MRGAGLSRRLLLGGAVAGGRVAVGTVDSYLVARLTRGLHHVTDASNAARLDGER